MLGVSTSNLHKVRFCSEKLSKGCSKSALDLKLLGDSQSEQSYSANERQKKIEVFQKQFLQGFNELTMFVVSSKDLNTVICETKGILLL